MQDLEVSAVGADREVHQRRGTGRGTKGVCVIWEGLVGNILYYYRPDMGKAQDGEQVLKCNKVDRGGPLVGEVAERGREGVGMQWVQPIGNASRMVQKREV